MKVVPKSKLMNVLVLILYIVIVIVLFELYGGKGVWGFIIMASAFGLYKMWIMRDFFMQQLEYIETMIWGKPLSKEFWKEEELKNTKVKIIWKSKKN